ncbi:hypothetical protein [Nocardia brasiliensis]|uniref:hypothetical protein n=1 Tax=Nocardia brasiliensis TaxID=37326 RepID=UPI003D93A22D
MRENTHTDNHQHDAEQNESTQRNRPRTDRRSQSGSSINKLATEWQLAKGSIRKILRENGTSSASKDT